MLAEWSFAIFSGLTLAMAGFLVAAGLTLVFGILKILNFAHGTFFMVGAYVTYSLVGTEPSSMTWFLASVLLAGLAVGIIGLATDFIVFRRLRSADYHYTLIATFALLLLVTGFVKLIWGLDFRPRAPAGDSRCDLVRGRRLRSGLFRLRDRRRRDRLHSP